MSTFAFSLQWRESRHIFLINSSPPTPAKIQEEFCSSFETGLGRVVTAPRSPSIKLKSPKKLKFFKRYGRSRRNEQATIGFRYISTLWESDTGLPFSIFFSLIYQRNNVKIKKPKRKANVFQHSVKQCLKSFHRLLHCWVELAVRLVIFCTNLGFHLHIMTTLNP